MQLNIKHLTRYAFDGPVAYAVQKVRLTPVSSQSQSVIDWHTSVTGGDTQAEFDDHYGNRVMLVTLAPGAQELIVESRGEVHTNETGGVSGDHDGPVPLWCYRRTTELSEPGERVRALVDALGEEDSGDLARLHALSRAIGSAVRYETGKTDSSTCAEDALSAGRGVCQDHAHIFISAARLMGIPARYVSGYLMMEDRVDQEASHAWAEAHVDGLGWVGFDVSNAISPDERYVRLATGLDYREAAPVSGVTMGQGAESMSVSVQVEQ